MVGKHGEFYIVDFSASAGGLDALLRFCRVVPQDVNGAFVMIQHLSSDYESHIADLFCKQRVLALAEATDGTVVMPNHLYLISRSKTGNCTLYFPDCDRLDGLPFATNPFLESLQAPSSADHNRKALPLHTFVAHTASPVVVGDEAATVQDCAHLKQELAFTRENLQSTVKGLERANEALQTTNAELLATNQELQTILALQNEELRQVQATLLYTQMYMQKLNCDHDNLAPDAYLILDQGGMIQSINRRAAELLGSEQHCLIGRPLLPSIAPQHRSKFAAFYDDILRSDGPCSTELLLATKNRHVAIEVSMAKIDEGKALYCMVMADTTHRRTVERALYLAKEQLTIILESIADGVLVMDTTGLIERVNPAAVAILGLSAKDLVGQAFQSIFVLFHEDTHELLSPVIFELLGSSFDPFSATALLQTVTNKEVMIALHISPLWDGDDLAGTVIVFRDETAKRHWDIEQLRSQKLDTLGTLAGGIAHDYNNLLAGFFGKIDLAKRYLTPDHRSYHALDTAMHALERATALTAQLLTFAKGGQPIKDTFYIQGLLCEAAHFSLHGSNVTLDMVIASDLYPVNADKGQLGQVISNLIINARQAMPQGGKVKIQAHNLTRKTGDLVEIIVSDQGCGIAPKHLARIFEPYFSTKRLGHGLGLTATHAIIQKHGGTITVDSELGVGTTFVIRLPAATTAPRPPESAIAIDAVRRSSPSARILILEDDESVCLMLEEVLVELGHTVTATFAGEEIVKLYAQALWNNRAYDVVIIDLVIPGGMSGQDAAMMILEIDPAAKLIASSGYAGNPIITNYADYGFMGRIVKPYRLTEFEQVLHQVLATPATMPKRA